MPVLEPDPFGGIPIRTSAMVPEDKVLRFDGALWFHSRVSARGRMRRRHGRPRNHPRRLKVCYVRYQPALDRVMEEAGRA
jgi:hypothetical protein